VFLQQDEGIALGESEYETGLRIVDGHPELTHFEG
jgi:hypothetical protein